MKLNKNLLAKLFIFALVIFSVTSCALLHESGHNSKKNTKKEVKSNKHQSKSKR